MLSQNHPRSLEAVESLGQTAQDAVADADTQGSSSEPRAETTPQRPSWSVAEHGHHQVDTKTVNQGGSEYNGPTHVGRGGMLYQGNFSIVNNFANSEDPGYNRQGREEQADIRAYLSDKLKFPEMDWRRYDIEGVRGVREETCQWLFATDEFKAWEAASVQGEETAQPILVLKGKPGSGKSVLMNVAFGKYSSSQEVVTIGFFNNLNGAAVLQHTKQGLYRSLLSQLLTLLPHDLQVLKIAKLINPKEKDWPDTGIVKHVLRELLQVGCIRDRRKFLFVDALDECQSSEDLKEANDVTEFLEELSETSANIRICVSLRDATRFEKSTAPTGIIDVTEHNSASIRMYLKTQLRSTLSRFEPQFERKLLRTLTKRSSNMFLWAQLVKKRIKQLPRRLEKAKILAEVEKTPSELTGLFRTLVQHTKDQDESNWETLALLQLVHVAVGPLTLNDMQSAMVYAKVIEGSVDGLCDDSERLTREDFADASLTAGLVELSFSLPSSRDATGDADPQPTVQFIHSSVREFVSQGGLKFLEPGLDSDPEAKSHLFVAKTCMRILSTREAKNLAAGRQQGPAKGVSFLRYASQFWTLHTRKAHKFVRTDLDTFLIVTRCSDRTKLILDLFGQHKSSRSYVEKRDIPSPAQLTCWLCSNETEDCQESMFVLLAFEGCTELIGHHARRCNRANKCHGNPHILRRAFFSAAHRGWEATARAIWSLAKTRGVDISLNMPLRNGWPSLHTACFKGEKLMAQTLLELGADPFFKAEAGFEFPLHAAVAQRNKEVVELFFQQSALVKEILAQKDSTKSTVLHQAAKFGCVSIECLEDLLGHMESHGLAQLVNETNEEGKTAYEIAETEGSNPCRNHRHRGRFREIADTLSQFASENETA